MYSEIWCNECDCVSLCCRTGFHGEVCVCVFGVGWYKGFSTVDALAYKYRCFLAEICGWKYSAYCISKFTYRVWIRLGLSYTSMAVLIFRVLMLKSSVLSWGQTADFKLQKLTAVSSWPYINHVKGVIMIESLASDKLNFCYMPQTCPQRKRVAVSVEHLTSEGPRCRN